MINASYRVSHTGKVKFVSTSDRLRTDSQLFEELGDGGFTVVAFASNGLDQPVEVIGTASMKKWTDDGLWKPYDEHEANGDDPVQGVVKDVDQMCPCPGDYELAVVAVPPDPQYRGKGIATHLVKVCDEEILRRQKVKSPVRVMIRTAKENAGTYWLKQGFTTVASRRCPIGFWGAVEEFTMWAMSKELSPSSI